MNVDQVKIMLIANAGILVEYQGQQLLIDALHEGHRLYPATPPEAMQALLDGREPFREIKAIVVTHNHIDHFSAPLTLSVLERYRETDFISDASSAEALLKAAQDVTKLFDKSRLFTMPWQLPNAEDRAVGAYEHFLPACLVAGPFTIQPVPFEHEGKRFVDVANVGLMITVGGLNILYPGDARMSAENFAILANHLPPVDVAVLMFPYIATSRGQNLVRDVIRPRNLIAVHWPDPVRDRDQLSHHAQRYFERTKDALMDTYFLEHYPDSVQFDSVPASNR